MIEPMRCANHPNVETVLRCNRCEKPICVKCAVRTPTGYRCKECVRGQQKTFNTAVWYDYLIGFAAAAILSLVATLLINLIAMFVWGLIVIAAAPVAGSMIASVLQWALRRRRARSLFLTCAAGVVAGALPVLISQALTVIALSQMVGFSPYSLISIFWTVFYLATATPIVYARLAGIQMTR